MSLATVAQSYKTFFAMHYKLSATLHNAAEYTINSAIISGSPYIKSLGTFAELLKKIAGCKRPTIKQKFVVHALYM